MQKVKIFKSIESELTGLEKEINRWLEESHAKILSITGNIAPQAPKGGHVGAFSASDVFIIVLYEDGPSS
jgi:hypothetical protein